ncbi:MAG: thiamine phosphate synthase [Candidatus Omnitrophica bacterium]|nr:thiamine phosphate synthase [Candidatus Omnitrophota bacterium]
MSWKKRLLEKSSLYVILDKDICPQHFFTIAKKIINSGAGIIQLRCKNSPKRELLRYARALRKLSRNRALLIVNDHIDVALASRADGVHLGQEDIPVEIARRIVGNNLLIGVSCHSLKHAKIAQKLGADYIGIGPVFPTTTKVKEPAIGLKILKEIQKNIRIPSFAIGGIDLNNVVSIKERGISKVAIGKAVCKAKDIDKTVNSFKALLNYTISKSSFA